MKSGNEVDHARKEREKRRRFIRELDKERLRQEELRVKHAEEQELMHDRGTVDGLTVCE
jgi:hypothetical protein